MTMGNYISNTCLPKFLSSKTEGEDESWHHVEFASESVHVITTKEAWEQKMEEAKKDDKIVVVNFSAAWCRPCKTIAPFYCELSEKHTSWMFLVVDVDVVTDMSPSWDIKATPTFYFFKGGKEFDKLLGANKTELQKKITAIINSETPKKITTIIDSETPSQS